MPLYNKFCNRCSTPFDTLSPDIYHCGSCRIISSQEEIEANRKWQTVRQNNVQSEIEQITWIPTPFYEQEGFWQLIIFGSILAWIAWPFILMFASFFFG